MRVCSNLISACSRSMARSTTWSMVVGGALRPAAAVRWRGWCWQAALRCGAAAGALSGLAAVRVMFRAMMKLDAVCCAIALIADQQRSRDHPFPSTHDSSPL